MFQSELQEYLITKFNLNTKSLVGKGDYIFAIDVKGNFTYQTQVTGTYRLEDTEYLPIQIVDWRNTPQPFKDIDLQDVVAAMRIGVRKTQLDDCFTAIEEFRELINGSADTIDGYSTGFRVSQPSFVGIENAGDKWIILEITVMASAGQNLVYGNTPLSGFKMAKTTETLVNITASDITISSSTQTNPKNVAGDVKVSSNSRTLQFTVTVFYEDNIALCNEFLDWLWTDSAFSQKYDISIPYSATITKTETVVITDIQQTLAYGTPVGFVMTMYKAI